MNRKALHEAALKAAREIVDAATAANRNLTEAERTTVQGHIDHADRLEGEIKNERRDADLVKGLGGSGVVGATGYPSWDDDSSEAERTLTGALASKTSARVFVGRKSAFFTKAAFTALPTDGSAGLGGTAELGTPVAPKPSPALSDVFLTQVVDSPLVRWYGVSAVSGVDVVAEGGLKPELAAELSVHDAPLVKLAGHYKLTTEFQQDAGPMVKQLKFQALNALLRRENDLILASLEQASGVLVRQGPKADVLDLLAEALGEQQALNQASPDVLIAHPMDVAHMRKLRTVGGGDYLMDPFSATGAGPFGMTLFVSPTAKPGTLWMVRREAAVWFQHASGVSVQVGVSGDDLVHNMLTTIIEERVLLGVTQPNMLTKLTLS